MPEDQIQIWKEFRSIRVQASIDDLEDRNHYIRYPTEWTDVLESIDILKRNEISWGIIQTISVMNIYHLPEFLKWATSMGADVVHNFVFNPYYLSPAALSAATKEKIYTRLEKEMPEEYMGNIAGVLKAFENSATEEFRVFTKEMDEIRGQSFKKTFPELNELLQVEGVEMS
jgi:MoaA/NifB/PqqE/SkfB family radical SAM enzyme